MEAFDHYISITGQRVIIPFDVSHRTIPLDKNVWEPLLTCSITQDYFQDPVILSATGNTYERKAIVKWFAEHDRDPLSNVLVKETRIIPNYSLLSILYRLESRGNLLLYHDISCEYRLSQFQAKYQNGDKMWYSVPTCSEENHLKFFLNKIGDGVDLSYSYVMVNRILDETTSADFMGAEKRRDIYLIRKNLENPQPHHINLHYIPDYPLQGLEGLLRCPISGDPLINATMSVSGISYSENTAKSFDKWIKSCYFGLNGHHNLASPSVCKNIIIRQISSLVFGKATEKSMKDFDFNKILDPDICVYLAHLKMYGKDSSIVSVSPEKDNLERQWDEIQKIYRVVSNHQEELKILSKTAREALKRKEATLSVTENIITHVRRELQLPDFNKEDYYGTDYSFLDLSFMKISDMYFKSCTFNMTNFTKTVFENCTFSCCVFFGADFTGCEFKGCKKNHCKTYECEIPL